MLTKASYEAGQLAFIQMLYEHNELEFYEYDLLKAKYSGKKSLASEYGLGYTKALSEKQKADKALETHRKNSEKAIIYGGAIGSAIGGLGGTIIGAGGAAQRATVKDIELQVQQAKAEARYQEELKNAVRRK